MRLKAIEMQGFKSFPDRTKLEFNEGVMVVSKSTLGSQKVEVEAE